MAEQVPVGNEAVARSPELDAARGDHTREVAADLAYRRLGIVNVVFYGSPGAQDRGWVLVNKETIVLTDKIEQAFRTDLFGYGIDVVATPTRWTWDFGDDSRDLATDSPGRPYPDFDVFNVLNSGTVLGNQYDSRLTGPTGFGQVLEIMNPRIARLGARFFF